MLCVSSPASVPVDGIITAGQTSVNQAVMTGESLPADKAPGMRFPAEQSTSLARLICAPRVLGRIAQSSA